MAKTVTEAAIGTRAKRADLEPGKVHWRAIDSAVHLGFRKQGEGGQWLVRWYVGDQKYKQATIGPATAVKSDGHDDTDAAIRKAREHVAKVRADAERQAAGPVLTVRDVIEAYRLKRDAKVSDRSGRESKSSAHSLTRHVLADENLADTPLHKLTDIQLQAWRDKIPGAVATKCRITNDFRAALNSATKDRYLRAVVAGGLAMPQDDKGHKGVRPNQWLEIDMIHKVVAESMALDEDFGRLVMVLAYTGARFVQVSRMVVADVWSDRLMVPASYKGRVGAAPRPPAKIPVPAGVIAALQPAMTGRATNAVFLERWRHRQIAPRVWERVDRAPWNTPSEMTRKWAKVIEKVGLPDTTIPYALRHSSIVRGLRAGMPVSLVALNHNTSVKIISEHYGAHISDSMYDIAARAVMPMVAL